MELEILDEVEHKGNISKLLPRTNALIRPAVANVDQALVIFAFTRPKINYNLLDRFLIQMERQQLPCVLVFNKMDIAEEEEKQQIREVYGGKRLSRLLCQCQKRRGHGRTDGMPEG